MNIRFGVQSHKINILLHIICPLGLLQCNLSYCIHNTTLFRSKAGRIDEFKRFSFLLRFLISNFLYLLSSDESDSLDDKSDNNGSESGSSSTYSFPGFPLCFGNFVVHVTGLGYGFFLPIGVEYKCDIFAFVVFVPIGVKSKGG